METDSTASASAAMPQNDPQQQQNEAATATDIAHGRRELRMLLTNINCDQCTLPQQQKALALMQAHPVLAAEVLDAYVHCLETRYSPLSYFVQVAAAASAASLSGANKTSTMRTTTTWTVLQQQQFHQLQEQQLEQEQQQLSFVQQVYELYPPALARVDLRGRLPLHEACSRAAPDAIIAFLAQQYPSGASLKDDCGLYPLHHALRGSPKASLATLELLLNLCPRAFKERDFGGQLPLYRALNEGYSSGVLQLLYRQWLEVEKGKGGNGFNSIYYELPFGIQVTDDVAKGVAVLFPHLDRFACGGRDAQGADGGMSYLFESLAVALGGGSCLKTITVRLPDRILATPKSNGALSYKASLQKLVVQSTCSSTLEELVLCGENIPVSRPSYMRHTTDSPVFQVICNGVISNLSSNNCRLESLKLQQMGLETDPSSGVSPLSLLKSLLYSPRAPRKICLDSIRVAPNANAVPDDMSPPKGTHAVLEELYIGNITGGWLYHLLDGLVTTAPYLEKLSVVSCRTDEEGLTITNKVKKRFVDPLIRFVKESKLSTLHATGLEEQGHYVELTQALASNRHIKDYQLSRNFGSNGEDRNIENKMVLVEILKTRNTSLVRTLLELRGVVFEPLLQEEKDLDVQISYCSRLNEYGRIHARSLETARSTFVHLLGAAIGFVAKETASREHDRMEIAGFLYSVHDAARGPNPKDHDLDLKQHNIHYGLLRENPGIWCQCSTPDNAYYATQQRKRAKLSQIVPKMFPGVEPTAAIRCDHT